MIQGGKVLGTKPNMSSIPGIYIVKERTDSVKLPSDLHTWKAWEKTCIHIHTHKHEQIHK